jgi:hypothetical protein
MTPEGTRALHGLAHHVGPEPFPRLWTRLDAIVAVIALDVG